MDMIRSLWILVFGILASYIVGLPAAGLAFNRKGDVLDRDGLWALAPFMGYGLITSILKLFIRIDIPVKYTALPFFLVFLAIFIAFCVIKGKQGKLRTVMPTRAFVLIVLAILALVSFAYLRIGAKWYKGFAWWDSFFYGAQAEFFRSTPLSQLTETVDTIPYTCVVFYRHYGAERISRGVMQAFVAAMTGVDGASTLGFISIFANLLVFHGLLYATKDVPMRKWLRYAGCGFSAVIPNVVMTHLECFIPVCLFTAFAIVTVKLLPEMLDSPNIPKSALVGCFIASVITTLLDGMYFLIGIALLAFFAVLIARRSGFLRRAAHLLLAFGCAVVLNLPYADGILEEMLGDMARQSLNFIASFSYSPRVLDWAFWGSLLEGASGLKAAAYMVLTLIAIGLLAAGLFALVHLLVRDHMPEGLTFCALAFSPLLFWIEDSEYTYAFYKMFTFAVPLISFGVWRFGDLCMDELDAAFLAEPKGRLEPLLRRAAKPAVCVLLCGVFAFSAANSVRKENVAAQYDGGVPGDSRASELGLVCPPEMLETYSHLESSAGKNILLIDTEVSLRYWWLTYYGRDAFIYSLTNEIDDTYYVDRAFERTDCERIPLDSEIVWTPGTYNMVEDADKQADFAAVLQKQTGVHTALTPGETISDSSFRLYVFAREAAQAHLNVTVWTAAQDGQPDALTAQGRQYTVPGSGGKRLSIPLELSEGGQMIELSSSSDVLLSGWTLEID